MLPAFRNSTGTNPLSWSIVSAGETTTRSQRAAATSLLIAYANPQIPLLNTVKYNPLYYSTESRFSFALFLNKKIIILACGFCFFSSERGQFSTSIIMIQQSVQHSFVFL